MSGLFFFTFTKSNTNTAVAIGALIYKKRQLKPVEIGVKRVSYSLLLQLQLALDYS